MSDIEMHKTFELTLSDLKKNDSGLMRFFNSREWFAAGWKACAAHLPQQPVAGKVTYDVVKDARFFLRVHSARQGNRETFIEALILIKMLSDLLVSQHDTSRDEKLALIKFCLEKAPGVTETYCPPHEEILAAFEDSQKGA